MISAKNYFTLTIIIKFVCMGGTAPVLKALLVGQQEEHPSCDINMLQQSSVVLLWGNLA